jgi:hypothetical protein
LKTKFFFLSQILSLLFIISSCQTILAQEVFLQDNKLLVAFDSSTGALIRMENKSTNWIIERRAELGVSFRLFVPLSDRRYNYVLGQKQKATRVEKISEHELQLEWNNLLSENGGVLPIKVIANVRLQEGSLTFKATLENNSSSTVETIDYPYFGDFNPPARNSSMDVRSMWYGNLESNEIYPEFNNAKGYWGVFCPTKTFDSNRSLFCLIQAPKEGLYVEMHNPTQPYLLQYTFEQCPGVISSITNEVPQQDEISGKQNHLEFRTTHFIFTHPKSKIDLVPVVIQGYSGDWHSGVDLYKQWRTTWFQQPHVPCWIKEVNSWQQLQINSPEQDYRVPYTKLIKYAEECAQNGINAIQVVGWNHGGQDGDDPVQDTDPGLGTRQELKDAIAKIQSMGVKIILFGKLNWADKTTDLYKNELFKYAATDPYNIPYEQGGYSYYTPTQLAAINNRRRAVMDFLDPAYRNIAAKEFNKLLDFGASGWLFDENCHHGPVKYSFDANHGYTPPGFIYGGDIPMAAQLRTEANKTNPDFLFAGEGHQDWLMQYYPCSYFRITPSSTPVDRYIDPKAPLVVAVTGFNDREMINLCLLDRYIIEYEPYNFKGFLSDFPLTLNYGKKVDLLRKKYKEYLWDADFRDTKGATVTADGSIRYSVFITTSGKRAVVVVNQDINKSITAKINLSDSGLLKMATPEHPDSQQTTGVIQIPVRSAAVVMEQ